MGNECPVEVIVDSGWVKLEGREGRVAGPTLSARMRGIVEVGGGAAGPALPLRDGARWLLDGEAVVGSPKNGFRGIAASGMAMAA